MPTHLTAAQIKQLRGNALLYRIVKVLRVTIGQGLLIVLALVVLYAAIGFFVQYGSAIPRWFSADSRLSMLEMRISNIPGEFERRSNAFNADWLAFKDCETKPSCDASSILANRDAAIALDWPEVFDRLSVYDDWGAIPGVAQNRDEFFAAIAKEGKERLRNKCVPKISFEHVRLVGDEYTNMYSFDGFSCTPAPATQ